MRSFLCLVVFVLSLSSCKNGFWTLDPITTLCVDENGDSTRICNLFNKGVLDGDRPVRVGHQVVIVDSNRDLNSSEVNPELVVTGGGFGATYFADYIGVGGAVVNDSTLHPIDLPYHNTLVTNQSLNKAYAIGGLIENDSLENIELLLSPSIDFQKASNQIFQYAAEGWSENTTLQVERAGHTATRFNNSNEIFIIGGNPDEGRLEIFTPNTESIFGTELIQNRYLHTATALFSGEILIVGGISFDSEEISNSIEMYSPSNTAFMELEMSNGFEARIGHTVNAIENQGAVIIGGKNENDFHNGIWIWNSNNDSLQKAELEMPIPIAYHTTTNLPKDLLLIAGGETPMGVSGELYLFNPSFQKLKKLDCTLGFPRYGHTTTLVFSNEDLEFSSVKLLIIGGRNSSEAIPQIEEIDLNLACTFF